MELLFEEVVSLRLKNNELRKREVELMSLLDETAEEPVRGERERASPAMGKRRSLFELFRTG
jgi:regulator of replication initiation timing